MYKTNNNLTQRQRSLEVKKLEEDIEESQTGDRRNDKRRDREGGWQSFVVERRESGPDDDVVDGNVDEFDKESDEAHDCEADCRRECDLLVFLTKIIYIFFF